MLGNSSILYILLSWKIALSDLHILAPRRRSTIPSMVFDDVWMIPIFVN